MIVGRAHSRPAIARCRTVQCGGQRLTVTRQILAASARNAYQVAYRVNDAAEAGGKPSSVNPFSE
jgi:hypothetical protein